MPNETRWAESVQLFLVLLLAVLVVWVVYWLAVDILITQPADRGVFGDKFGGLNTLFSAFAFAGLIFAILLQRNELRLQRMELQEQRRQLSRHADTVELQRFENTFFNLVRLHQDILASIRVATVVRGRNTEATERAAFVVLMEQLRNAYQQPKIQQIQDEQHRIAAAYATFYEAHQVHVGHYFRNLYHVVRFIEEHAVETKSPYVQILRAQLSTGELALLLYNCLSEVGVGFKAYVERFHLLHSLPEGIVIVEDHRRFFAESAFGGGPFQPLVNFVGG